MDSKQLIASIIGSVASIIGSLGWPSAVLISLVLFRKPIERLIDRIKKVGSASVNVEFSELVKDVAKEGQRVEVETGRSLGDIIALDEAVLQRVEENPEAAVRGEYQQLGSVISQIGTQLPEPIQNPYHILIYLRDAGLISKSVINLWEKIRRARYGIKGQTMTAQEALVLIRETRMLASLLRSVGDRLLRSPEVSQEKPRP